MRTTLSKYGEKFALILEQPLIEHLGANEGTLFEVVTDGQTLILSPVQNDEQSDASDEAFDEALVKANILYSNALKRLAE